METASTTLFYERIWIVCKVNDVSSYLAEGIWPERAVKTIYLFFSNGTKFRRVSRPDDTTVNANLHFVISKKKQNETKTKKNKQIREILVLISFHPDQWSLLTSQIQEK